MKPLCCACVEAKRSRGKASSRMEPCAPPYSLSLSFPEDFSAIAVHTVSSPEKAKTTESEQAGSRHDILAL